MTATAGVRADLNRDGRLATVRFEQVPGRITVALGASSRRIVLPSVDRVTNVALLDIDGDGDLDILGSSDRYGILLWRNTGRGRFVASRPARSRLAVRRGGPIVVRGHRLAPGPEAVLSDTDRNALAPARIVLFQACLASLAETSMADVPAAVAVARSSRGPPVRLIA